jgi:anti-anti-sigma factor
MELYTMETDQQATLLLKGRFDLQGQQQVRGVLEDLVAGGKPTVTFDLSGVTYIDSSAVGLLFLARETCEKAGGSVILSRPQEAVDRVLKLCRLEDVFRIERGGSGAVAAENDGNDKRKVLIIDGSEDKRFLLSSLLARHKFSVTEAEHGEQALQQVQRDRPDLILLDIALPGELDGFEIYRRLKAAPETAALAVLFVTAPAQVRLQESGVTVTTEDFIPWPVEPAELVARVKTRLGLVSPNPTTSVTPHRVTEHSSSVPTVDQREKELERARLMQARFFPETFPLGRGLSFAGRHRASHKIGGDLFDVQKSGEERLAFMIADVSGHGVAAALLTGMLKVLFLNSVQQCEDPGLLLGMLNEELLTYCGGGEYLTMFVGIWDPGTQTLLYSGAGHPPAYVSSADGSRVARLGGGGGVLGVVPDAHFKTMDLRLKPKQRLVLYTDGITEQSNPQQELFGEKQLVEVCTRWATLPLDTVVELVYSEVDLFAAGEAQADDQALLLVEVTG